jgi:hypothetical protein
MINKKIREEFSWFNNFDDFTIEWNNYSERRYSQVIDNNKSGSERLGLNGVVFLLKSLNRSQFLFKGFVDSANSNNSIMCFLATRAYFETTSSISYFLYKLQRFYLKQIDFKELDNDLFRLSLGRKCDKDIAPSFPEPINVLKQIEVADKIASKYLGEKTENNKSTYEFLSEFCHPNLFGTSLGTKIDEKSRIISFYDNAFLEKNDAGVLFNCQLANCKQFFVTFDDSWGLLKQNEFFPELIK